MKRTVIIVGAIAFLCIIGILVYTAFPYDTYACLKSHTILVPNYTETCENVGKSEECTSQLSGFYPETVCDVYSSPTPEHGWLYK